jgi:hypothetical protein
MKKAEMKQMDTKQPKINFFKPSDEYEKIEIRNQTPKDEELIVFENTDDFNIYYNKHLDDFKNKTTVQLNRKYRIKGGYVLSQQSNGDGTKKLVLRHDYKNIRVEKNALDEVILNRVETLENSVKEMIETINDMGEQLTKLIKFVNNR